MARYFYFLSFFFNMWKNYSIFELDFFDRTIRKVRNWNQKWVLIAETPCIWTFLSPCYLNFSIPLLFELFYPLSCQTSMYFSSIFWFLFLCIVFLFKIFYYSIGFYSFHPFFIYSFCSCLILEAGISYSIHNLLIFIGIPCFFLEISIGQYAALGPVTIYSSLSPLFKGKIPY